MDKNNMRVFLHTTHRNKFRMILRPRNEKAQVHILRRYGELSL